MTTSTTAGYLTLIDWAKRSSPSGGIDQIVELLAASNPILQDANVMEGNLPTGHQFTQRATVPSGSWRMLNYGVAGEKSTTKQFTDVCSILEAYSPVDVDIALLNGNEAAFRASEDNAFIAGLSKTMATAMFYGNQGTDPEQPQGLAPRFNSLSTGNYAQVISGSGAGSDNTSIWFVTWGPQTCTTIFPKGSVAGLVSEDLGRLLQTDSNGLRYMAYVTRFQWKIGLSVIDPRYIVRICNIDSSDLTVDATSGCDLLDKMIDAYYTRPTDLLGTPLTKTVIYCNPRIAKFLHKQARSAVANNLTIDQVAGQPVV